MLLKYGNTFEDKSIPNQILDVLKLLPQIGYPNFANFIRKIKDQSAKVWFFVLKFHISIVFNIFNCFHFV
jgi:hypothetical protein